MTYKRMRRRAIARGVMDGVYESLTGKRLFKDQNQNQKSGPRSLRGRRSRKHPVRPLKWMK